MKKVCLYFIGGTIVLSTFIVTRYVMDTYFDPENSNRNYNRIFLMNIVVATMAASYVEEKVFHNITEMLK